MSNEPPPPDFDQDDENKGDDLMFQSTIQPVTAEISLTGGDDEEEEEDDENPFGDSPVREKTLTNTTNTVESSSDQEKKVVEPEKTPVTVAPTPFFEEKPTLVASAPSPPLTPVTFDESPFTSETSEPLVPIYPKVPLESQVSSSSASYGKTLLSETVAANPPARKHSTHRNDIEISVSEPSKVGDGMGSYMVYRITTKTTMPIFQKSEFTVTRRFSDFLGLHDKVAHRHLHVGLIIPSPPEKDTLSMAKVKISKDEGIPTDFLDRRRALLERYLNRLAQHPKLIEDNDVREFLEQNQTLPKSTSTAAVSGAGFMRMFSNVADQVTKLATKTSEQDQWFEDKYRSVIDLQRHLKHLYDQMNHLFSHRKETGLSLKHLSTFLNHLATVEENPLLSNALVELANLEEKLDQNNNDYTMREYSTLTELTKEYIFLLEMVKLVFQERIKAHQRWLDAEDTLKKKRENKTRIEQNPKSVDKLPQAEMEIRDWDEKVIKSKEEFEHVSSTIKQEMEVFEQTRFDDFKLALENYLKNHLEQQERLLQIWETFLPEANKINI